MDSDDDLLRFEASHELDLFALEEEVRTKRRSLQSKITSEHYIQQKRLEESILAMEADCKAMELKYFNDKEEMELDNQVLQSRLDVLNACFPNRMRDFQSAFDAEVDRINQNATVVKEELTDIRNQRDPTEKMLEKIQGDVRSMNSGNNYNKLVDLERKLYSLRQTILRKMEEYSTEDTSLRNTMDNSITVMDEEIINMEEALDILRSELRALEYEQRDQIDNMEYEIRHLNEIREKENSTFNITDAEEAIRQELIELEVEIQKAPSYEEKVLKECNNMKERLTHTMKHKLELQESDIKDELETLLQKLKKLENKCMEITERITAVPEDYVVKKEELMRNAKSTSESFGKEKTEIQQHHKKAIENAKATHDKRHQKLEDVLTDLSKKENAMLESYKFEKKRLEDEIDRIRQLLPPLEDTLLKTDSEYAKVIGNLRGRVEENTQKHDMTSSEIKVFNASADNALKKLDMQQQPYHEKYIYDVQKKEREISKLLDMHDKMDQELEIGKETFLKAISPVQQEINSLTEGITELTDAVQRMNKSITSGKDEQGKIAATITSARDKSRNSFAEEQGRLQKIIGDETRDQSSLREQMENAIQKATAKQDALIDNSEKEISQLTKQLMEKQALVMTGLNLQGKIKILQQEIKKLDQIIQAIDLSHRQDIERIEKRHRSTVERLSSEKVDNERLLKKVGQLQSLLFTVDEGLQDLRKEDIFKPREVAKLKETLSQLHIQNKKLESRIAMLTSKHDYAEKELENKLGNLSHLYEREVGESFPSRVQINSLEKKLEQLVQQNKGLRETLELHAHKNYEEGSTDEEFRLSEKSATNKSYDQESLSYSTDKTETVQSLVQKFQTGQQGQDDIMKLKRRQSRKK